MTVGRRGGHVATGTRSDRVTGIPRRSIFDINKLHFTDPVNGPIHQECAQGELVFDIVAFTPVPHVSCVPRQNVAGPQIQPMCLRFDLPLSTGGTRSAAAEWPRVLLQCKCSVGNMQCFDSNPVWRGSVRFMCISGPEELGRDPEPVRGVRKPGHLCAVWLGSTMTSEKEDDETRSDAETAPFGHCRTKLVAPDTPGMLKRRCTCCFMSRITSPRSVLQHVSAKERQIRNQYSRASCFMFLRDSEVAWVILQFTEDGHKYQLLSSRKPDNRTHVQQHGEMGKCYIQFSRLDFLNVSAFL